jgi:intracellular sulfur oxidation DsrE/DsrF family protein
MNQGSLLTFPEHDILPVHIEVVDENNATNVLTAHYDISNIPTNNTPNNDTIFDSVVITNVKSNATVNQMCAAAINHMKTKGKNSVQILHGCHPMNEFYNPDLFH